MSLVLHKESSLDFVHKTNVHIRVPHSRLTCVAFKFDPIFKSCIVLIFLMFSQFMEKYTDISSCLCPTCDTVHVEGPSPVSDRFKIKYMNERTTFCQFHCTSQIQHRRTPTFTDPADSWLIKCDVLQHSWPCASCIRGFSRHF